MNVYSSDICEDPEGALGWRSSQPPFNCKADQRWKIVNLEVEAPKKISWFCHTLELCDLAIISLLGPSVSSSVKPRVEERDSEGTPSSEFPKIPSL